MKKSRFLLLLFLFGVVLLAGCVYIKVAATEDLASVDQLTSGQILVTGKIELIPPLAQGEQLLHNRTVELFKNKIYFLLGSEKGNLQGGFRGYPTPISRKVTNISNLGETFFLPLQHGHELHFAGGIIIMNDRIFSTRNEKLTISRLVEAEHFTLRGTLTFHIPESARAVYIGTLQYFRDEFNTISSVRIKDEYSQANSEMRTRYHPGFQLIRVKPSETSSGPIAVLQHQPLLPGEH